VPAALSCMWGWNSYSAPRLNEPIQGLRFWRRIFPLI
jgi:hypothetical protein